MLITSRLISKNKKKNFLYSFTFPFLDSIKPYTTIFTFWHCPVTFIISNDLVYNLTLRKIDAVLALKQPNRKVHSRLKYLTIILWQFSFSQIFSSSFFFALHINFNERIKSQISGGKHAGRKEKSFDKSSIKINQHPPDSFW